MVKVWVAGTALMTALAGPHQTAQTPPTLAPDQARHHRGQIATVCGPVISYICPKDKGTTLNLTSMYTGHRFSVVIPPSVRPPAARFEDQFLGRQVCVTGKIERKNRRLHDVTLSTLDSLEIVAKGADPPLFAPLAHSGCDSAVTMPKLLKEVKPAYTEKAMRGRVEGNVFMRAIVEVNGSVGEVRFLESLHPGLDQQAMIAFKQWRFEPGTFEGRPVPVVVTVDMSFRLKG